MHRKTFVVGTTITLLIAVIVASFPPATNVQADNLLQNVPSLEGYEIYFSETGGDASRFDRTDAGLSRFAGLLELLGADMYTLEWRNGIPNNADLVVIPGPTSDLSEDQVAWLWAYLQGGGNLLLLADVKIGRQGAFAPNAGLFALMWEDMGLRGREDVVVTQGESRPVVPPGDTVRADTPTPTPLPAVQIPGLVPDFLTANINAAHPIGAGIDDDLAFFSARSLEVDEAPREAQVTALVFSDTDFYGETDFATYQQSDYAIYDADADTAFGSLVLAAAMQDAGTGARVVLIGDREFATNGGGLQTSPPYSSSFLYPGNIRFLINAVTWLLDAEQSAEFTFPTPGPTNTPTLVPTPTATPMPEGEGETSS